MSSDYHRTCFRDLGTDTFDNGNRNCQALGGHLPIVKKSAIMTFLANKFGQLWMSLKTNRFCPKPLFLNEIAITGAPEMTPYEVSMITFS